MSKAYGYLGFAMGHFNDFVEANKVKVNAAARMALEHDPANPDENIEYYQAKLSDLYEKFRPFAERPGLFPATAEGDNDSAQSDIFENSKPEA